MKYFFLILIILPGFVYAQQEEGTAPFQAPQTVEEARGFGEKVLWAIPDAVGATWQNEVVPLWTKLFFWVQDTWNTVIWWRVENLIETMQGVLGMEVEKRSPVIKEEIEKKKQEISQEIQTEGQKFSQSLWERFVDLFKDEKKKQ